MQNWQEITLGSESFEQARNNFDMLLQKLFQKMEQNASDEGKITLVVNIKMDTEFVPDPNGGTARRVSKPVLKHKINTEVPVKDSFDGQRDTGMELAYDDELKRYVLKYVSDGAQASIFDPEYSDVINGTAEEIKETPALPGESRILEGPVLETSESEQNGDSDVIDAEYREVTGQEEENGADGDTEAAEDDDYSYED